MSAILAKYATAKTIYFPLVDAGAADFENTPVTGVTGDVQYSIDGGSFSETTNNIVHEGNGIYSLDLEAVELSGEQVVVTIIDSGTKEWEDQSIYLETYGNVNAHMQFDFDASVSDVYHARIDFNLDENNTQDEYNVMWYKNGVRVTSGITSPTVQVIQRSDGNDLIPATGMTEVGSTHYFKYDDGTNRITNGEGYVVVAAATIDGEARSFARWVSRDVTA